MRLECDRITNPDSLSLEVSTWNLPLVNGAQPTPGLVEIEPSMAWNPSVISGVGIVDNVRQLYHDMHSYLAAAGVTHIALNPKRNSGCCSITFVSSRSADFNVCFWAD